ncbi:MAG: FxsA family protein [Pseudomonadota bacterium]
MPILLLLLIALIAVPLVEIYVILTVGQRLGAGPTIALIIITAIAGAWLLRREGLSTLARAQSHLQNGELPALELLEGLVLLVTGALLLTPGFCTDAVGFVLLIPQVRRALVKNFAAKVVVTAPRRPPPGDGNGTTYEGDYRVERDNR